MTVLTLSPWVLLSWPHWVPAQGHITWEQGHMAPALSSLFLGKSMRWLRCSSCLTVRHGPREDGAGRAGDHRVGQKWLLQQVWQEVCKDGVFFPGLCQNQSSRPPYQTAQVPQLGPQGLGGEAWAPATPPPMVATHLAPPLTAAGPTPRDPGGCVAGVAP